MFFVQGLALPVTDDDMITVARRCHSGVDLYARSRNSPWGSQGGTFAGSRSHYPAHNSHNIKENILVGRTGHACLSGFSRLTIASDQPATTPLAAPDDAIQWMSPELIAPTKFNLKESRPTKKSDCYSLGMAIYEVLSEKVPFAPRESTAITSDVVGGERPGRPQGGEGARFTDGLWWMLEDCWKPQPDDRPSLDIVLGCLQDGGKRFAQLRRGNPKSGWTSKLFNTLKAFKFHTGRTRES